MKSRPPFNGWSSTIQSLQSPDVGDSSDPRLIVPPEDDPELPLDDEVLVLVVDTTVPPLDAELPLVRRLDDELELEDVLLEVEEVMLVDDDDDEPPGGLILTTVRPDPLPELPEPRLTVRSSPEL